ncbi:hypothetical protein BJF96_g9047 [Verticillium dahliae]|uniref:Uncharacterized protein n=1 Tax=Verticillium dahliae TaxID=27337 RepID=A0AA44WAS7_VERDA|nr:hypothetical protein BJF96_g9047 [Verticillium dahliae]
MAPKLKIAAIQAEPAWNDLEGISLSLSGVSWGRSIWAQSPTDNAAFMDEYLHNSLVKDSDEMRRICAAVKEAGAFVVLGYSERFKSTLYIAQVCYS